ncbi:hypothetical protein D3C71_1563900 [compost metagenome]
MLQRPPGVADGEVEAGPPLRQVEAVEAGGSCRPDGEQGVCGLGQLGPGGEGAGGFLAGQGETLDGEDVQTSVFKSGATPEVQQGDDVQARTEAQFGDSEV